MLTVQLTLDQYECELHRSTYMWIFSVVSTSVLYDLRLVESTPTLFKGQLYISPVRTCVLSGFRRVRLLATVWTIAHKAPLSLGFSRQGYWSGLPFPSPGDLPNPGIKPVSLMPPALAGGFFTMSAS